MRVHIILSILLGLLSVQHVYARYDSHRPDGEISHNTGAIEQVTHYYPFGAVYSDAGTNDALQRYKYNGKELDRMHGLNLYDYGARNYDPLLGRFDRFDSKAWRKPWQSPYTYGRNNPLRFIDPDGNEDLDKFMGYVIGSATNIIPFSNVVRNWYSPTDAADYNSALQTTDKTFMAIGTAMSDAGKGGATIGMATVTAGGTAIVGSAGTATVAGGAVIAGGGALTIAGTATGLAGSIITMNATNNKNSGYGKGNISGASKNERHGDGGRAQAKADKQLSDLQNRLTNATSRKEKMEIRRKINNIKKDAERKRHGEEHSKANKR